MHPVDREEHPVKGKIPSGRTGRTSDGMRVREMDGIFMQLNCWFSCSSSQFKATYILMF